MKQLILLLILSLGLFSQNTWANTKERITLWGTPISPFVRKVISVLEEKQLGYTLDPTLPESLLKANQLPVPSEFKKISPLGKVPAIQIGALGLADSAVIVNYLENKWPQKKVYPSNPEDLAKALWYEKYADTVMADVFNKILIEKIVKPIVLKLPADEQIINQSLEQAPAILAYLENELQNSKTRYLVNDQFSIADIAVTHHFVSMKLSNISLPLNQYPHLADYIEHALAHPSIQASLKKI